MNPLLQQFIHDAHDLLENMGTSLLALEKRPDDEGMIDELFRAVHTLKGNSGLFDFPTLTRVVHAAEDVLDKVREKELSIDTDLTDELLDSMDFIQRMVEAVEQGGQIPDDFATEAESRIDGLRRRLPDDLLSDLLVDAAGETIDPPAHDWMNVLPAQQRLAAFRSAGDAKLISLRYVPEPECFFKGEDPLRMLSELPGRLLFSIRPLQPFAEQQPVDIYRCNLEILALATAPVAELQDFFRYVPEQMAMTPATRMALAMPEGPKAVAAEALAAFRIQAAPLLSAGDMSLLAALSEATAGDVAHPSWAASALTWLAEIARHPQDVASLPALVDALAEEDDAKWQAALTSAAVPSAAPAPTEAKAEATTGSETEAGRMPAMVIEILGAQRRLLDMVGADEEWSGRLSAVGNTLSNLLGPLGKPDRLQALAQALEQSRTEASFLPLAFFLDGILDVETGLAEEVAIQVADTEIQPVQPLPAVAEAASGEARRGDGDRSERMLKVSQEKVDRLMDLIGEMVVAKNALPYLASRAEDVYGSRELAREIKAQFAVINRIAEDMQDGIMQVRMLPMNAIFQRFPRLVRDVARQLDKKVRLVVEGEEAEADKHIVESLGDPLIHILRNSLDHGLESPETRRAAGKSEEGRIVVRASQEGDRVFVEIEDDGRGIDPAIVKRKAFEKGLIDEARLETISDADAIQLVFAPGFSTAETVSNLSGRGVGMDVVRNSIQKIGGQVRLSSELGKGTRIQLTLPLSLAVSNVLMVRMDGQRYGVPMDTVVETVRVAADEIHEFKGRRMAVLRGRIVPLFGADELLSLDHAPLANADGEYAVLIARVDGATVGLIVDGFAQTTDVILKPLDGPLSGLAGFAGSALLGDGSVLLVLDLKELVP